MERRSFLTNASAMVLAAAATRSAFADAAATSAAAPVQGGEHGHRFTSAGLKLAMTANHCVGHGDACLQHCIDMLSKGDTSMAACASAVREMLTACRALGEAAARGSKHLKSYAKIAAEACKDCEDECRKHKDMPVCLDCADACAECLTQCKSAAAA